MLFVIVLMTLAPTMTMSCTAPAPGGAGPGTPGGKDAAAQVLGPADGAVTEFLDAKIIPDRGPLNYDLPPRVIPPSAPDVQAINTRACGYLKMGPFAPVTPSPDYSYMAPPIKNDQQAYRLTIPAQKVGHVTFVAPTAGEYVIFTSTSVSISLSTLDGLFITDTAQSSVIPECSEVKLRRSYLLRAETHVIRFGPQNVANVDVVVTDGIPGARPVGD
jgi:hypothetical protein